MIEMDTWDEFYAPYDSEPVRFRTEPYDRRKWLANLVTGAGPAKYGGYATSPSPYALAVSHTQEQESRRRGTLRRVEHARRKRDELERQAHALRRKLERDRALADESSCGCGHILAFREYQHEFGVRQPPWCVGCRGWRPQ